LIKKKGVLQCTVMFQLRHVYEAGAGTENVKVVISQSQIV